MSAPLRRIVTGLDAQGRSCVLIDGPPQPRGGRAGGGGLVWRTATIPAENGGSEDAVAGLPADFDPIRSGGSGFMVVELPPTGQPFMHATDTVDYIVMMQGRVTLVLEAGEVALGPGDLVVDRGVRHGWRNDGPDPAVFAIVFLPAHPLAPPTAALPNGGEDGGGSE